MTESKNRQHEPGQPQSSGESTSKGTKQLESTELFAGQMEVEILHAGETYRLRKTRTGKLILTK